VDLTNDYTVKSLIHGIAAGLGGDSFSLDLSGCKGYSWGYVSGISTADKEKITALTLPPTVTEITGGVYGAGAFAGFSSLASCTATGVTDLGDYAFSGCTALATVNLPAAQTIGERAFYGTSLTTVSLPQATTIGDYAFASCTDLETVSLPQATTIGNNAFYGCTSLTTVSFPLATSIGGAFYGCTALATVTLDAATTIGDSAFSGCTTLGTVSLPQATSIGDYTFSGCTALASVTLSAATTIGDYAFQSTGGTELTLTLGSTPPAVENRLFYSVTAPKTVKVKRPSSAIGYTLYTDVSNTTIDNWANAFRGGGWIGGVYGTTQSYVNTNVTVTFIDS
jgi:hypothetical protein